MTTISNAKSSQRGSSFSHEVSAEASAIVASASASHSGSEEESKTVSNGTDTTVLEHSLGSDYSLVKYLKEYVKEIYLII